MTFLELAERVLKEVKKPLSVSEIWDYATKAEFNVKLGSQGKTPSATLGAQLHVNARDNKNSLFATIGSRPKKFYLKSLKYNKELLVEEDLEAKGEVEDTLRYSEKDLHQLLAYFVYYHMKAHSKTLDHTKTSKKYYGEWIHPDMVACYFSIDELKSEVYDLIRSINKSPVRFYSFEIKKKLSFGNLRESFFQAVSNSSWAHESYLVTSDISEEKEFTEELVRLCNSFGIGVILLDVNDPDDSEIVIDADAKDGVEVDTINKLAINPDFKDFLVRIRKDVDSKEIRKEWYDRVESRESLIKFFKNKKYR
ncbi:MAG TPA: HTH domain-containing protein [Ohtaekwangia sp.]|uniref:HTH domain-containing protein n=1 Tax=Ohtaekwangia sp. TaxID=2066019 RepID=UPI002F929F78